MKIAVWSPTSFAGRKSSHLLLLALQTIATEGSEQLILHADADGSGPEHFLLSGSYRRRMMERKEFGVDLLAEMLHCERFSKELVITASYSFADGKLHVLPAGNRFFYQGDEKKVTEQISNIIQYADTVFQNVWIELPAGDSALSEAVLSQMDCVIVNLGQSPVEVAKIEELKRWDNSFYLVGAYEQRTIYSVHNLEVLFPSLRRKCAVIPYNTAFLEACCRGGVEDFWKRGTGRKETEVEPDFWRAVEQAYGKWKEGWQLSSCGEEKNDMQSA